MSIEERDVEALVAKVWAERRATIENTIGTYITSELSTRAQGRVVKLLREILYPMVEAAVKARQVEIEKAVEEQVVGKMRENLDAVLKEHGGYILSTTTADILHRIANRMRDEALKGS